MRVLSWRLAGPSAFGWTGATDESRGEISSEDFLKELVENHNVRVYVNRIGKDIVGFCVFRKMVRDQKRKDMRSRCLTR